MVAEKLAYRSRSAHDSTRRSTHSNDGLIYAGRVEPLFNHEPVHSVAIVDFYVSGKVESFCLTNHEKAIHFRYWFK